MGSLQEKYSLLHFFSPSLINKLNTHILITIVHYLREQTPIILVVNLYALSFFFVPKSTIHLAKFLNDSGSAAMNAGTYAIKSRLNFITITHLLFMQTDIW